MFFLGVLLPRQVLNRLTFAEALSRRSGYTFLMPSEAYQYYCFPLIGFLLLSIAIWTLQPPVEQAVGLTNRPRPRRPTETSP